MNKITEVTRRGILENINKYLNADGYEIYPVKKISGRDIYGYKLITDNIALARETSAVKKKFDSAYISAQVDLMYEKVDTYPHDSIGKAKELIESCCKQILKECNFDFDGYKTEASWGKMYEVYQRI
jgi:hypothetical protein